jgi:hypothetical protein
MHDLATGQSMSGILPSLNQTPFQWFSKKQNTAEMGAYVADFIVTRQATEQMIDHRYKMMGIPIDGPVRFFGYNESVVTSSTIPQST